MRRETAGFTLIEVIVTMSLMAILAGIVIMRFDQSRSNLALAQRIVGSSLRLTRADAITRGAHYQVEFGTDALHVARMTLVGDHWEVAGEDARTVSLPAGTQLAGGLEGRTVEFNTRGMAVNLADVLLISVENRADEVRQLEAWPSGQVNDL